MSILFAIPMHKLLPSSMSTLKALRILNTKKFSPIQEYSSLTWKRQNIPSEMEYHDTDGTSLAHSIPEELGGIYLYCDGPISAASSIVGTAV
jgi:hypothetical protein